MTTQARQQPDQSRGIPTRHIVIALISALLLTTGAGCVSSQGDNQSTLDPNGASVSQGDQPSSGSEPSSSTSAEPVDSATTRYAVSFEPASELWQVADESDRLIGVVTSGGKTLSLTDIARLDDGQLIGVSFEQAFTIDPATAVAVLLGDIGVGGVNALATGADGILYAATTQGELLTIDEATGVGTAVAYQGDRFRSSGDLTQAPNQRLYLTAQGPSGDLLLEVDPLNGLVREVVSSLPREVFGLARNGDQLIGLVTSESTSCTNGALVEIPLDKPATETRCLDFAPGGLTG